MNGQLDVHAIGQLEQKLDKVRFVRVDSDTIDRLIPKEEVGKVSLEEEQREALQEIFKSQLPKLEKQNLW